MYSGMGVSEGIVKAKLHFCKELPPTYEKLIIEDNEKEQQVVKTAFMNARKLLEQLYDMAVKEVGLAVAGIVQGHLLMVSDISCQEKVVNLIQKEKVTVHWALQEVYDAYIAQLMNVQNPYQQSRTMDLKHVLHLIQCEVEKVKDSEVETGKNGNQIEGQIAIGNSFSIEDILLLYHEGVVGFIDLMGEEDSHSIVVVKSLGLPMIIHMEEACLERNESYCTMDGLTGKVEAE